MGNEFVKSLKRKNIKAISTPRWLWTIATQYTVFLRQFVSPIVQGLIFIAGWN